MSRLLALLVLVKEASSRTVVPGAQAQMTCPTFDACVIQCHSASGCADSTVTCPTSAPCRIECLAASACRDLTVVNCGSGGQPCVFLCGGLTSCKNVKATTCAALGRTAPCSTVPAGGICYHDLPLPGAADANGCFGVGASDTTSAAPDSSGVCGASWFGVDTVNGPRCFKTEAVAGANWLQSAAQCELLGSGASIATIDDAAANSAIQSRMPAIRGWIGLNDIANEAGTDKTSVNWVWRQASPGATYRNWRASEPSDPTSSDCVYIQVNDGYWGDMDCSIQYTSVICSKSVLSPTVAPSAPPPTHIPTAAPTAAPTTGAPSVGPAIATLAPSRHPSGGPQAAPSSAPLPSPTVAPTLHPHTSAPTLAPTLQPARPTTTPSGAPAGSPTTSPSRTPTSPPTLSPVAPSVPPSAAPTRAPTARPEPLPSTAPTQPPAAEPTSAPSASPTQAPVVSPSALPTLPPAAPSASPTLPPAAAPSAQPTLPPAAAPSAQPTPPPAAAQPTPPAAATPSALPSAPPSAPPTQPPASLPPSAPPSASPTLPPAVALPAPPSAPPTLPPASAPSAPPAAPTSTPRVPPTSSPAASPSASPAAAATSSPTFVPPQYEWIPPEVKTGGELSLAVLATLAQSPLGAAQSSRVATFLEYSSCPPDDLEALSFMSNPTRWGSKRHNSTEGKNDERRDVIFGNALLVGGCAVLNLLCGLALHVYFVWCRPKKVKTWRGALAIARFPSFTVFPALTMLQHIAEPAVHLLIRDPRWQSKLTGLMGLGFALLLPGLVFFITAAKRFVAAVVPITDPTNWPRLCAFLWGTHRWGGHRNPSFERRYALFFKDFYFERRRFLLAEIGVVLWISLCSGYGATTRGECIGQIVGVVLVYVAYISACLIWRPFLAPLDLWCAVTVATLQLAAISVALAALIMHSETLFLTSNLIVVAAAGLLLLKALFDIFSFCRDRWNEVKARRRKERRLELERSRLPTLDLDTIRYGQLMSPDSLFQFSSCEASTASPGGHGAMFPETPEIPHLGESTQKSTAGRRRRTRTRVGSPAPSAGRSRRLRSTTMHPMTPPPSSLQNSVSETPLKPPTRRKARRVSAVTQSSVVEELPALAEDVSVRRKSSDHARTFVLEQSSSRMLGRQLSGSPSRSGLYESDCLVGRVRSEATRMRSGLTKQTDDRDSSSSVSTDDVFTVHSTLR
eukprot:TRINITY_DN4834_c0_g1_i5.p1 TRINITY_DN4834_c0_g1~~TRINITY_DN4834_c0_g1_i5.p1  ORF type:complete len:1191 (+),score=207.67 TRINITY_DN4834_c0_g1_i5:62-3634(+)